MREPEASGAPGTSQPSITRPARLHITRGQWSSWSLQCLSMVYIQQLKCQHQEGGGCQKPPLTTVPSSAVLRKASCGDTPRWGQPYLPWCPHFQPVMSLGSVSFTELLSPLLCQLPSNLSLRFSQLDFYRLRPNVCWKSALCTQQGKAGSQYTWNEFFLINALFKMVHDALVESVHV